ncbi:MAG: exodeoxyribonuclease III [Deltaproteobacteria bacterium]|nr:exodeoxyribonuclease III [Deltaproteobacteria bacterium]
MKIASFNVNSVRVRLNHLLDYLEDESPDIVGLQETKVTDKDFPREPFEKAGYRVFCFGEKSYNGVALITKEEPVMIQNGFKDDRPDDQKRFQLASFALPGGKELNLINGYFPQGETRDHPVKFPLKMAFYDKIMETLDELDPNESLVVMGDLNISPHDSDIGIGEKNAARWLKEGKCSFLPEERERITQLREWGLFDSFREKYPLVTDRYSWFDFRSRGFEDQPKRGLRIDQIWVTKSLMDKCVDTGIDYHMRGLPRPSDHCLIWAEFQL